MAGLFCLGGGLLSAQGQSPQLVTALNPASASASAGGDSISPIITPDGRYVLFSSAGDNLAVNSNGVPFRPLFPGRLNVYRRDLLNGVTVLASVSLDGTSGGSGESWATGLSTNGQFALFESIATNLVAGDSNNVSDIFVRDIVNNTTILVSANINGGFGSGISRSSVMTPDGRYVAFVSAATNLVASDANGINDVFVRDLQTGTTTLVSVGAQGTGTSESPDISADGRYVVFYSTATGLATNSNSSSDIYVRDLTVGTTKMASFAAHAIVQSVFSSTSSFAYNHTISDDGQYIAYQAAAANSVSARTGVVLRYNLSSGVTDTIYTNAVGPALGAEADYRSLDMTPDGRFIAFVGRLSSVFASSNAVYVWDGQFGSKTLASVNLNGAVSGGSECWFPQISTNGNVVSFYSSATNLVAGVPAGDYYLFVRDLQAGVTTKVDVRTNGSLPASRPLDAPALSSDGRYVAFASFDSQLVTGDGNRSCDVFVLDRTANVTGLISTSASSLPSSSPNGNSVFTGFSMSTDVRYVAFSSEADNLTANDTNGCRDVFVHDKLNGTNLLVSWSTNGVGPGNGISSEAVISGNGSYVAFSSFASDISSVPDGNGVRDVFVRDMQNSTNILVSVNSTGTGTGNAPSYTPLISGDGRYVLFHSQAGNLVSGITATNVENIYLRDVQLGTTLALVTNTVNTNLATATTADGRYVAYGGGGVTLQVWDLQAHNIIFSNAASVSELALSPDGRRLVYSTSAQVIAADLVAGTNLTLGIAPTNGQPGMQFSADGRFLAYNTGGVNRTNQVNLYDFQKGTNLLVSKNYALTGGGNGPSDCAAISPDGRFVAYRSMATNIIPGDTNGFPDIFLYDQNTKSTMLVSGNVYGNTPANNFSFAPCFSGDSQYLLFQSWASDLVPQDFNQGSDLFALNLNNFSFGIVLTAPGSLAWPVVAGKNYLVQYKNSLTDANWQPLDSTISTNNGLGYWNDPAPPTNRFYRVVAY